MILFFRNENRIKNPPITYPTAADAPICPRCPDTPYHLSMALEEVRSHFRKFGMEDRIMELEGTTATVADAASAHGVEPGQIGKTLSFRIGENPILIVVAGDAKIANAKYKARFGTKARMLRGDEVMQFTGHPIGGVCPFGLPRSMDIFLDESLKRYDEVIPAAGSHNSSIRLSLEELEGCSGAAGWVDVCALMVPDPV